MADGPGGAVRFPFSGDVLPRSQAASGRLFGAGGYNFGL